MDTWQTVLLWVVAFTVFIPSYFFVLGKVSQKKQSPGLEDGQLKHCSRFAMNCVCSEYPNDKLWYQAPMDISTIERPLEKAKQVVEVMGGDIVAENEHYMASTFTSSLYKFVDDVEFRLDDSEKLLHIRSASRVGQHDAEANKKRVKKFRKLFLEVD